ncbi:MAG TPA: 2'-5' RNA ligase family protein [Sphingobium sp.]|uniref:2'-5' RNA ligase family protein n=1 Tax=Sphingobium sp. TaxID=1912891 RepID=UPI002ED1F0A8
MMRTPGLLQTGRGDLSPIIVTAEMAPADQAWADGLRRRHFPPERNQLAAHITLFHHLPPGCLAELQHVLAELAREARPRARVDRLISLGNGVAFHVESPELLAMREEVADRFAPLLMPQDAGRPRLHITVQNKVASAVARATQAELEGGFTPRPLGIRGLAAWHYRGGPWELIRRYGFRG